MRNKWLLSGFIIVLAILGISLDQAAVPNQEIIIHFSNSKTNAGQTQEAIALVKSQLNALEVDNLKVEKLVNGTLKVSYYSNIEVSKIKKIFSDAIGSNLKNALYTSNEGNSDLPFGKDSELYHLDIYKIQDFNDLDGSSAVIIELKLETTRSYKLDFYALQNKPDLRERNTVDEVAYNTHKYRAVAIKDTSNKIPEVRAGPTS